MAGNSYFAFKRFTVEQADVAMRVNTDGVLLGAWFTIPDEINPSVLDAGCGTGVIALMASQRLAGKFTSFSVGAVEIDNPSCIQAQKNFAASPWKRNLVLYNSDYQSFCDSALAKYNAIVSNPPYFVNSLKNPSQTKKTARHTDSLPYEDLLSGAKKILKVSGHLSVILPAAEFGLFEKIAEEKGYFSFRKCRVFSKEGDSSPIRIMAEFSMAGKKNAEASQDLCIMNLNLEYTPDYKSLTKDFYLKF